MPKISVIVPIYKVEKYLRECVDSILAQTFKDFELILVDDGSPDGCGAICDEYRSRDERVVVIHKQNGGVSSARNAGIEAARGEWIAFVDGDDVVFEKYLSDFANFFNKENVYIVFSRFLITRRGWQNKDDKFMVSSPGALDEFVFYLWKEDLFGYVGAKILRREIIKKYNLRFSQNLTLCEDLVFALDYVVSMLKDCSEARCALIDKKNYFYRPPENPVLTRHNETFVLQEQITGLVESRIAVMKEHCASEQLKYWNSILFSRAYRAFVSGFFSQKIDKNTFPKYSDVASGTVWKILMSVKFSEIALLFHGISLWIFYFRVLPERLFFTILLLKTQLSFIKNKI